MNRETLSHEAQWLDNIPTHWHAAPLGSLFRERRQQTTSENDAPLSVTKFGIVDQLSDIAISYDGAPKKLVEHGDIVINSRSDRKGSSGIAPRRGSVSVINTILEPKKIVPQYAHHLIRSVAFQEEFYRFGTGIVADLWSTRWSEMKNILLPAPPAHEQQQIADYLDHETAEIDAFIADLHGAGELRKERWRSGRDRALAFGVSGDGGRTRKSATWFDVQRTDWSEGPLKRLFDITLGKMLDEKQHVETAERHPYIRAGNIQDGLLELEDVNTMPFTPEEQAKFSLREMDLLVVEGGSVGTNVVLNQDLPGVYFQKTVNRMRPRLGASSYYYSEVLNAYRDRGVFNVVANKSTIQHLTADKLANLEVPIPPVHEQHEIADALSKSREKVASVGLDIAQAIDLARERRAALITAAVTGQIDVTAKNKPAAEQLEDDVAQGLHREYA